MSETMENIKWDPKVKEALDSFDWNNVKKPVQCNTSLEASCGLLVQVDFLFLFYWSVICYVFFNVCDFDMTE